MRILKFGGTSIANVSAVRRVIGIIKNNLYQEIVVVVSAIAEATNTLSAAYNLARTGKLDDCKKLIVDLREQHIDIVYELIKQTIVRQQLIATINLYLDEALTLAEEIMGQSMAQSQQFAQLVAYGELLSSAVIHSAMDENGIRNRLVDARSVIITDNNYAKATPLEKKINDTGLAIMKQAFNGSGVVLTQGFIGATESGVTTILGREGSDYSASLIGAMVDADEIQIWTDVDGVMSSDPRKISNTYLIPQLSFNEAAELSYFGAKVIHPLTIKPAARKSIPLRILNSLNTDPRQQGTLICGVADPDIRALAFREKILSVSITPDSTTNWLERLDISPEVLNLSSEKMELLFFDESGLTKLAPLTTTPGVIVESLSLICLLGKTPDGCKELLDKLNITRINYSPTKLSSILVVPRDQLLSVAQKLHDCLLFK